MVSGRWLLIEVICLSVLSQKDNKVQYLQTKALQIQNRNENNFLKIG